MTLNLTLTEREYEVLVAAIATYERTLRKFRADPVCRPTEELASRLLAKVKGD